MGNRDIISKTIYNLEKQLLQPEIRSNRTELDYLISNDFIEYGASGRIYNKKDIINQLIESDKESFFIYDFTIRMLGEEYVQSMYRIKMAGKDGEFRYSLRSSIWENKKNRWQIVFHQGTKFNKNVE
ncbi:MAG: DUF4440 domain-containing protein [Firmicutes bacterium]|jgi:hypothetical protein|nr:DUF4440 domain-containing protein [Bacillota bacterium]